VTNTLTVLYEQRMKRDFDKKKRFWGLESLGSCRVVVIVWGLLWGCCYCWGVTLGRRDYGGVRVRVIGLELGPVITFSRGMR